MGGNWPERGCEQTPLWREHSGVGFLVQFHTRRDDPAISRSLMQRIQKLSDEHREDTRARANSRFGTGFPREFTKSSCDHRQNTA